MVSAKRPRLRAAAALVSISVAYSGMALLPLRAAAPDALLTVVCGMTLATAIVLGARLIQARRTVHFAVWFALVFLNLAAVAIEGTLFAPAQAPPSLLGPNLLRLMVVAAVVAGLTAAAFGREDAPRLPSFGTRPLAGWAWRVLAAGAVYAVLYLVVGGLNYSLVTRPYYEAHAGSLTVPPAGTVLLYEPFRGIAIALSVLPLTLVLRIRTAAVAVVAGILLFVVGGLVPLLPQASLPLFLRVASLWEIFAQNFLTGVACAYLFVGARAAPARVRQEHPSAP